MAHDRLTLLLSLLLIILLGGGIWEGISLYRTFHYNRALATVTFEVDETTPPALAAARANRLAAAGQWQRAVQIYTRILPQTTGLLHQKMAYNLGTLYLGEAAAHWHKMGVWDYSRVVTLLGLARQYLREAVRLDPTDLEARYNLEYALRIQPPPRERQAARWQGRKQSVFATLPGLPKGGP